MLPPGAGLRAEQGSEQYLHEALAGEAAIEETDAAGPRELRR